MRLNEDIQLIHLLTKKLKESENFNPAEYPDEIKSHHDFITNQLKVILHVLKEEQKITNAE